MRGVVAGTALPGVANIGTRPTFGDSATTVEVHLLDWSGDLYGEELAVDFIERLRDERPFPGISDLRAQISSDVDQARRMLGSDPL